MENSINRLAEIAQLYDEFFVIEEPNLIRPKENEKNKKSLTFLGGYKSRILWVYDGKEEDMGVKDKEMIHNLIVNAIKITWDDVAFLNLKANTESDIEAILTELKPRQMIVWGGGSDEPKYTVINKGEIAILYTDEINQFHADNELKRKLWESIRLLMNI